MPSSGRIVAYNNALENKLFVRRQKFSMRRSQALNCGDVFKVDTQESGLVSMTSIAPSLPPNHRDTCFSNSLSSDEKNILDLCDASFFDNACRFEARDPWASAGASKIAVGSLPKAFDTSWLSDLMSQVKLPSAPTSTDGEVGHESDSSSPIPQALWQQLASPFQSPKATTSKINPAKDWFARDAVNITKAPTFSPYNYNGDALGIYPRHPASTGILKSPYSPHVLLSVIVRGLDVHVTEEDLVLHFTRPPSWPDDHPMKRMYTHVQSMAGSSGQLPTQPAPFKVYSARIIHEPPHRIGRVFGFVRLISKEECDRALVELQHTHLIPKRPPHFPLRLCLSLAAAPPAIEYQRRGNAKAQKCWHESMFAYSERSRSRSASTMSSPSKRPTDVFGPRNPARLALMPAPTRSESASSPSSRSTTASTSISASTSTSMSSSSMTSSTPNQAFSSEGVPTVLTFVSEFTKESDSKEQPHLASALTKAHASSALDPTNTTVFVGSLFSLATENTLHTLFAPFGPIQSINIPRGQDCGFVQFANKQDAARAIAEMQGFQIVGGGALRLSWGRSVGEKAAARAAIRAGLRWVEDSTTVP